MESREDILSSPFPLTPAVFLGETALPLFLDHVLVVGLTPPHLTIPQVWENDPDLT